MQKDKVDKSKNERAQRVPGKVVTMMKEKMKTVGIIIIIAIIEIVAVLLGAYKTERIWGIPYSVTVIVYTILFIVYDVLQYKIKKR